MDLNKLAAILYDSLAGRRNSFPVVLRSVYVKMPIIYREQEINIPCFDCSYSNATYQQKISGDVSKIRWVV